MSNEAMTKSELVAECYICAHGQGAESWIITPAQVKLARAGKLACPRCGSTKTGQIDLTNNRVSERSDKQQLMRTIGQQKAIIDELRAKLGEADDDDEIDQAPAATQRTSRGALNVAKLKAERAKAPIGPTAGQAGE